MAGARTGLGIPCLIGFTLKTCAIFSVPFGFAGNARVFASFILQIRFVFGATTLGDSLVEAKSFGAGNALVILKIPSVGFFTLLAFTS